MTSTDLSSCFDHSLTLIVVINRRNDWFDIKCYYTCFIESAFYFARRGFGPRIGVKPHTTRWPLGRRRNFHHAHWPEIGMHAGGDGKESGHGAKLVKRCKFDVAQFHPDLDQTH
jgi:hypothetical protein